MTPGPVDIPLGAQFRSSGLLADFHKIPLGLLAVVVSPIRQLHKAQGGQSAQNRGGVVRVPAHLRRQLIRRNRFCQIGEDVPFQRRRSPVYRSSSDSAATPGGRTIAERCTASSRDFGGLCRAVRLSAAGIPQKGAARLSRALLLPKLVSIL